MMDEENDISQKPEMNEVEEPPCPLPPPIFMIKAINYFDIVNVILI